MQNKMIFIVKITDFLVEKIRLQLVESILEVMYDTKRRDTLEDDSFIYAMPLEPLNKNAQSIQEIP